MKITAQLLQEHDACKEGYDWFVSTFGENAEVEHTEIIQTLIEKKHFNAWIHWLYMAFKLSGEVTLFYENGQLSIHCHYDNGNLHGEVTSFYSNGQIEKDCYYDHGYLNGEFKRFYENGQLEKHAYYDHDTEVTK